MDEELSVSLREYTRAIGGGLVIGLPLLFTMEIWWHAFLLPAWKILLLLGIAFVIVLGYNSVAGFRRERTFAELAVDSVATIGLGIVVALVGMLLLGRIDAATSLRDAAGKVALEAIPIAFGASVAITQLSGNGGDQAKGAGAGAFARLFVGRRGGRGAERRRLMKRHVVEWAALLISVAGIAVLVGVLLVAALTETRPADPRIELHMAEARAGQLGWIVPATLFNEGNEAVEAVILEASATVAGEAEVSEMEVDFLPAGTSVEVAFAYSQQPEGPIDVRLVAYRLP